MRIGINNAQDVFALLIRRKWWIVFPFVALSCAVALLVYFLPHTYVSETLILVRPRDVPQDFVRDLIASSPEERLRSIEQQILSRTNLIQIMREFGDKLPELKKLNIDDQVVKLRAQIKIDFELGKARNGTELPLTYFRISYQNQSPELAQKIASKLTTLFIEQDNKTRETQVYGTTEFFNAELEKVQQDLDASEQKLREVKSSRQFELPDQRDANLRTLDRLSVERKTNLEALDRVASSRLTLEGQIAQTPAMIAKPILNIPGVRNPLIEKQKKQEADLEELRKAQTEYDELSSKYTQTHPDVLAAKAKLERTKQRIPPELLAAADAKIDDSKTIPVVLDKDAMEPNPVYQKLIAQLEEVKTEQQIRDRGKVEIDREISKYTGRIEKTPQVEQDISEVLRQNNDLKKQYENLKAKLAEARLAESLESKQKGSNFQIVDPANYPIVPSKPNKLSVLLSGIVVSLIIAIVVAVGVDVAYQKVWTQSQAETFWGAPVLVEIPEILTDADVHDARRKKVVYGLSSVAGLAVYSVCLYGMYLKHDFILRHLDPVIQKLIYK